MSQIARLGDGSSHGGHIISSAAITFVNGIKVARVGDLHSCVLPGHGTTAITNGSTTVKVEGKFIALQGVSLAACGAIINTGSPNTNAQ